MAAQLSLERIERWAVDARFRLRGPRPPGLDVATVVAFDDRTHAEAPLVFERRVGWARHAAGAKVLAMDALSVNRGQVAYLGPSSWTVPGLNSLLGRPRLHPAERFVSGQFQLRFLRNSQEANPFGQACLRNSAHLEREGN